MRNNSTANTGSQDDKVVSELDRDLNSEANTTTTILQVNIPI